MNQIKCMLIENKLYDEQNVDKASDELLILSSFLNTEITDSPDWMKQWFSEADRDDYINLDCISIEKKGNIIELNHQYIDNLNSLTLPIETLIKLIDTWVALVKAKTKEIIITEENGVYTIKAGNTK